MLRHFRVFGRVTRVIMDDGRIAVFHIQHRDLFVAFDILQLSLPVEYINRVVRVGAEVRVFGEMQGAFPLVRFICNPFTWRERVRIVFLSFAMGFAQGLRTRLPMAEFVNRSLLRVWIEKQCGRFSMFRKLVR